MATLYSPPATEPPKAATPIPRLCASLASYAKWPGKNATSEKGENAEYSLS